MDVVENSGPVQQVRTIIGTLINCNTCNVGLLTTNAEQPIFEMCKQLLAYGHDRTATLLLYRDQALAVSVREIGIGADLIINSKGTGFNRRRSVRTASPVRKSGHPRSPHYLDLNG